jgi:pilus assembly protein CpaC
MKKRNDFRELRVAFAGAVLMLAGLGLGAAAHAQAVVTPTSLLSGGEDLVVPIFKSRVVRLDVPATRISVGSPDIADILILRSTQLYVLGRDLGTTNVMVWDSEDRLIGAVNVEVTHDLEHLRAKLHELLPNETISVYSTQRSIVLAGQVSSPASMNAALRVADNYLAQVGTAVETTEFEQEGASRRDDRAVGQVINLMQVGGVQQVMLEIKVAEINRNELRRMDAQWHGIRSGSPWTWGGTNSPALQRTLPLPTGAADSAPWTSSSTQFIPFDMVIPNQGFFATFMSQNNLFNMALDIARENRLARILAEPTLTTLTGQEASFLSGGEIAIPVPQGFDRVTFEFKDFGVGVSFLPVVLGSGLINLKVDVSVSEITRLEPGSLIPLQLGTRRASTSVELREGQTMGIAGLIDENVRSAIDRFPGLGSIPVLGALFRSQEFLSQETELVIIVTPRLAQPMGPGEIRLPTDNYTPPNDAEFFLMGRLEGRQRRGTSPPATGSASQSQVSGATQARFGHQLD